MNFKIALKKRDKYMGLKAWLSVVNLFMRRYSGRNLALLILRKPVSASQFFPLSLHLVPELSV